MTNFDVKLIDFIHKYSTFWFKKKCCTSKHCNNFSLQKILNMLNVNHINI